MATEPLGALRGLKLGPEVARAAELLATVIGQDIEKPPTGGSSSPKGVPPDRVISVVAPGPTMGTSRMPVGLMATRGMWRSTPTARSSVRPRRARPTPEMPRWASVLLAGLPQAPSGQESSVSDAGSAS
jgi:hypothetical protein